VGAENNRYGGSESAWPAEIVREVRERFKQENLDATSRHWDGSETRETVRSLRRVAVASM